MDGRTFLPGLLGHLGGDDLKMSGEMLGWLSLWGEVQICIWPADTTATHCLLFQEIQTGFTFLVLPFWYWLNRVVPDKIQRAVQQL